MYDTGNTHILQVDLARIYGESNSESAMRVDRGRAKISAWLMLLESLEDYSNNGCDECGAPKCVDKDQCRERRYEIAKLADSLPIENLIQMNPRKWYAALQAYKNENRAFEINLD